MLPVIRNSYITPFVDEFENKMNSLINEVFKPDSIFDLKNKIKNSSYPKIDIFKKNDEYVIQAMICGVKPEDLSVEMFADSNLRTGLSSQYVKISGKMSEEHADKDATYEFREIKRSAFSRTLALPDYIKDSPDAKIKDGLLTLTWKIPRPPTVKLPEIKKIAVKSE